MQDGKVRWTEVGFEAAEGAGSGRLAIEEAASVRTCFRRRPASPSDFRFCAQFAGSCSQQPKEAPADVDVA